MSTELQVTEENQPNEMQIASEEQLNQVLAGANRYLELQDRMRKLSIKVTNADDWVNQGGKPYLQLTGTNKIARAFGVQSYNLTFEKEVIKDDKGEYVIYHAMCDMSWNNKSITSIGACSTRDSFFGKTKAGLKPLSEIDMINIKKKAQANVMNRGIKQLLGLSFTWDDIEKYSDGKVTRGGSANVTYAGGTKGGKQVESSEITQKRTEIVSMLVDIFQDDLQKGSDYIFELTNNPTKGFAGKKTVKDLTAGQIPYIHSRIKTKHEKVKRELIEEEKKNANT